MQDWRPDPPVMSCMSCCLRCSSSGSSERPPSEIMTQSRQPARRMRTREGGSPQGSKATQHSGGCAGFSSWQIRPLGKGVSDYRLSSALVKKKKKRFGPPIRGLCRCARAKVVSANGCTREAVSASGVDSYELPSAVMPATPQVPQGMRSSDLVHMLAPLCHACISYYIRCLRLLTGRKCYSRAALPPLTKSDRRC